MYSHGKAHACTHNINAFGRLFFFSLAVWPFSQLQSQMKTTSTLKNISRPLIQLNSVRFASFTKKNVWLVYDSPSNQHSYIRLPLRMTNQLVIHKVHQLH